MSLTPDIVHAFEKVGNMIASLRGPVLESGSDWLVVGAGPMGVRVDVPATLAAEYAEGWSEKEISLYTSLIVREDSLTLIGFKTAGDRDAFSILMSVSGIGPRLALAAIDTIGVQALRAAIANDDLASLQRISGVGKKTAQRMVLEIGDKLGPVGYEEVAAPITDENAAIRDSVEAALEQLGWPRAVATRAVDSLEGDYLTTEAMLRAALGQLGANRGFSF